MIDGLKPYPEYRESGVQWLGQVPAHWEVLPNRALFAEVNERNHPGEQLLSVTIARGVIKQSALLENSSKKDSSNQDKSSYKLVLPEDLAYNKMRAWQGAVGVSEHRGIVSPAYVVVRPRARENSRYFHYLLRTPAFAKEAERWSYGITSDQWSLRPEHFRAIHAVVPPTEEQDAIARFLDHADRRIRRYIRAKQKLIKLLEEKRRSIVHGAVTRGLGANLRLKPAGMEDIEVPEHWEVSSLGRYLRRIEQGRSPRAAEGETGDDQWAVISLSAVDRGRFNAEAIKPIARAERVPAHLELFDGDFLLTRSNTRERVADVTIVSGVRRRTIFSDLVYRLSFDERAIRPAFLMYQLLSPLGRRQIERAASGASGTMPKVSQGKLRAWRVLLPPPPEQQAIVEHLDRELSTVNRAVSMVRHEVSILTELRARLTADVVTGKLDVREPAARLPNLLDGDAFADLMDDVSALDTDDADAPDPELQEA